MITISQKGDFKNTERYLQHAQRMNVRAILQKYGDRGVAELSRATPKDSGLTASSWNYRITMDTWGYNISWFNTNVQKGVTVAILIQYGHGTGTGGYVQPTDYINPAMRSIFDSMTAELVKEVMSL